MKLIFSVLFGACILALAHSACTTTSCGTSGLCVASVCICVEGFSGPADGPCAEANECSSNPCINGGTCLNLINAFLCQCPTGFTGVNCGTPIGGDVCNPNPCGVAGICQAITHPNYNFVCLCPDGQYKLEPCTATTATTVAPVTTTMSTTTPGNGYVLCPNQAVCQNQGMCLLQLSTSTFTCICAQGFSGLFCEIVLTGVTTTNTMTTVKNGCNPNPCYFGGTCVTYTNGGFMGCYCPSGYTGTYCQCPPSTTKISSGLTCNPSPCWNGAVCSSDSTGKFVSCNCPIGWYGTYCDLKSANIATTTVVSAACTSTSCRNGGVCTSKGCVCPSGYSGQYCETLTTANLCQNIACKNGGVCNVVATNRAECWCLSNFYGYYCEIPNASNRCADTQCLNGGTCIENTPGYTTYSFCQCKAGYAGARCETQYFRCTTNGKFADTYGCDNGRYFECTNGVATRRDCGPGLRFNPSTGTCDYAINVRC